MSRTSNTRKALIFALALGLVVLISPGIIRAAEAAEDTSFVGSIGMAFVNGLTAGLGKMIHIFLETIVLTLASGVMSLTGMFLDSMIKFSIGTTYIINNAFVINQTWSIIRDICNLFFIFALIWMSLATILGIEEYNAKRKLTHVIIAAIIINFSLFFTKVLIDLGNIVATWLYDGVMQSLNGAGSISALLADRLGIAAFWSVGVGSALGNWVSNVTNPSMGVINTVFRLLVVLAATYLFAYSAVLFISRAVTILFLLALSPIGFIGELLPQAKKWSDMWREELTAAISFPVIFLIMLYIAIQFINGLSVVGWWEGFTQNWFGLRFQDIFRYVVVISLLFGCLDIAKKTSGTLGEMSGGIAKKFAGFSTAIGGRAAALTGQFTIGAAAKRMADSTWLNKKVAEGNMFATMAKGGLGNAADFHYDARTAIDAFGVKGGKGYKTFMKEAKKEQEEAQEAIAPTAKEMEAARQELDDAEHAAYMAHPELRATYDSQKNAVKEAKRLLDLSTGDDRNAKFKAHEKEKAALEKIKNAIKEDTRKYKEKDASGSEIIDPATGKAKEKSWNYFDTLHAKQGDALANAEAAAKNTALSEQDRDEAQKKVDAINAARRQQEVIDKSKNNWVINSAKGVDKFTTNLLGDKGKAPKSKMGKAGKYAARVLGADLLRAAARQTVSEQEKITKGLGEARAKPDKKKKNSQIEGILNDLAAADTPPAAPPGPTPSP